MWIFGYDENKRVFEVDVPVKTVVAKQIDPWRLDLFDPDPVICDVGAKRLYFRKLQDVAFAYQSDGQAVVCVHDGAQTACLGTKDFDFNSDTVVLRKPHYTNVPFSEHLHRYLCRSSTLRRGVDIILCDGLTYARPSNALELSGTSVKLIGSAKGFSPDRSLYPIFTGEMFRTVPISVTLPPKLNWVFEKFGHLNPLVLGGPVRRVLAGLKDATHVGFPVPISVNELREFVQNLPAVEVHKASCWEHTISPSGLPMWAKELAEFTHDGTGYRAWVGDPELLLSFLKEPSYALQDFFSADGVYATGVNQVHATRIALYDVGHLKTRAVSHSAHTQAAKVEGNTMTTRAPDGMTLESVLFKDHHFQRSAITDLIMKAPSTPRTPNPPSRTFVLAA